MNILGIGVPELIIIVLILLVIAGPRRMAAWAYLIGREMAKLRKMWAETMGMIQQELKEAGLEEIQELKDIKDLAKYDPTAEVRKAVTSPLTPKPAQPRVRKNGGSTDGKAAHPKPTASTGTTTAKAPKSETPTTDGNAAPHPEARPLDASALDAPAAETGGDAAPPDAADAPAQAGAEPVDSAPDSPAETPETEDKTQASAES